MNGRFAKLEIEQPSSATRAALDTEQIAGTPVRTAQHDLLLATDAYHSGQFENALQLYTRALRGDRSMIPAWVGQVQMLVELGEYPEARLWADKSLELFKNNGDLLAAKARACLRQRDRAAAVACSDASLASPGTSPQRWQARGEVLLDKAPDRARDCFERSLTESAADWFDRLVIARAYLFHRYAAPAVPYAQAGVQLQPASSYAWLTLARCQDALGWGEQARNSYERALQLPGDRTIALNALSSLDHQHTPTRLARWVRGLFRR